MLNQVVEQSSEVSVTLEVYTKNSDPLQYRNKFIHNRTLVCEGLFPEIMNVKMCLVISSEY